MYSISDCVVYKIDVHLWIDWNRPEIGSKQDAVNAAHLDRSLEAKRAWTHGIHIDIRLEILRRLTKVLINLVAPRVSNTFIVQVPVPIESANNGGESSAHVNEKNFKLWVFIEDAAIDHPSGCQRRIKWPA